jgi:DNA repair photolyase
MFPTTHDITPVYLPHYIAAAQAILGKGHRLLLVSKPHKDCISKVLAEIEQWKAHVTLRFTIGTIDGSLAAFWEPGAPSPAERLGCLRWACERGWTTSVSMEPFLGDWRDAVATFRAVAPFVTDKVWIGKMNKVMARVRPSTDEERQACEEIIRLQSDEALAPLLRALKGQAKVSWKDSLHHLANEAWKDGLKDLAAAV